MRTRPRRREQPRLCRTPVHPSSTGFHIFTRPAGIPDFDSLTFSVWLRPEGNTTQDGTVVQFTYQYEDLLDPGTWYYEQILRLRWFRADAALSVEIWDETAGQYVTSRPLGDLIPLARGETAHLHGIWTKAGGLLCRKNGTVAYERSSATTTNDIQGGIVNWHAICGGQGPPVFTTDYINQYQGAIADLWVGFNQQRAWTDFVDARTLKPYDLGASGDVGGGQPLVCFSGNSFTWNAGANRGSISGYERIPNFMPMRDPPA